MTEDDIYQALSQVIDPELGINIVDLGLIYHVEIHDNDVNIRMTLTTHGCPLHETIETDIQFALHDEIDEVEDVNTELVWQPPWSPEAITQKGRQMLWG